MSYGIDVIALVWGPSTLTQKRQNVTADKGSLNEEGMFEAQTSHPMLVDSSSLKLTTCDLKQFGRAMKALALTPKVHSSQLNTTLSAYSPENSLKHLDADLAEQEDTDCK